MKILSLLIIVVLSCQVSMGQFKKGQEKQKKLFPKKMLFTQKLVWGPNSIFRDKDKTITMQTRRKEFKIRKQMIKWHEYTGYAALGLLAGTTYTGFRAYAQDRNRALDDHKKLAALTNLAFFASSALVLFAPPLLKQNNSKRVKMHRWLALTSFAAMIISNATTGNKKLHKYTSIAATGLYVSSVAVMRIKF